MSNNAPWSFEENVTLLKRVKAKVDSLGRPKWADVAEGLPNRSAQEARCRYRRIIDAERRRLRGERFRNVCHKCGQLRRGHVCTGPTTTKLIDHKVVVDEVSPPLTINRQRVSDPPSAELLDNVVCDEGYPSLPFECQSVPDPPSVKDLEVALWNARISTTLSFKAIPLDDSSF